VSRDARRIVNAVAARAPSYEVRAAGG